MIARAAAVALHPADDRLPHAAPVRRHRAGVEARAAVAHEHLRCARPSPPRRRPRASRAPNLAAFVIASRAAATTASCAWSSVAVADHHHLDRHAVLLLHLGGGRLERARKPRRPARAPGRRRATRAARAPAAGPAPPPPRDPRSAAAPARASGARSRAGARPPRRAPASGCAPRAPAVSDRTSRTTHGAKITPSTTTTAIDAEQDVARGAECAGGLQEHEPGRDHERDADAGARDRAPPRGGPPRGGSPRAWRRSGGRSAARAPRRLAPSTGARSALRRPRSGPAARPRRPRTTARAPRNVRSTATQQQAGAERHLDGARDRCGCARAPAPESPAGIRSQPSAYAATPTPPAAAATTNASRTSETSMP